MEACKHTIVNSWESVRVTAFKVFRVWVRVRVRVRVRVSVFLPEWKWSEGYAYVIGLGLRKGKPLH